MTNDELGRRIGVGHSMASRIRNGKRLPSTGTLHAIHREIGIPLDELLCAHEEGPDAFGVLVRAWLEEPVPA